MGSISLSDGVNRVIERESESDTGKEKVFQGWMKQGVCIAKQWL